MSKADESATIGSSSDKTLTCNDVLTSLIIVPNKLVNERLGKLEVHSLQLATVKFQGHFDLTGREKELRPCCFLIGYQLGL